MGPSKGISSGAATARRFRGILQEENNCTHTNQEKKIERKILGPKNCFLIVLDCFNLCVHDCIIYSLTKTLSKALLDRGFCATSSSDGLIALREGSVTIPSVTFCRINCLTILSSRL